MFMTKYQIKKDEVKKIEIVKPGEYVVELVGEGAEAEISGVFEAKEILELIQHSKV